jgi:hypothetical protein
VFVAGSYRGNTQYTWLCGHSQPVSLLQQLDAYLRRGPDGPERPLDREAFGTLRERVRSGPYEEARPDFLEVRMPESMEPPKKALVKLADVSFPDESNQTHHSDASDILYEDLPSALS